MASDNPVPTRRIIYALQNGTGAVLSKLAVISVPFLLGAVGALLNSTIEARDRATQQSIDSVANKVDGLSSRVDGLTDLLRQNGERAMAAEGDLRELQAQEHSLEKRFDERAHR